MLAYENRICLFADLLGFSSLVKSSSEGDDHHKQQGAMRKLARAVSIVLERNPEIFRYARRQQLDAWSSSLYCRT